MPSPYGSHTGWLCNCDMLHLFSGQMPCGEFLLSFLLCKLVPIVTY